MTKIGIAGAGGLGSNVAAFLVRAGVKELRIVDFDVVQASNLNRQFFFHGQIGRPKVEALAENLRGIDPEVKLDCRNLRVDESNVLELFGDCGYVVEAFDGAEDKAMLVSAFAGVPDKIVVSGSGVAGLDVSGMKVVRRFGNVYVAGDGVSDVSTHYLYGAKVTIAAAMMAAVILKEMGCPDEK